jgi:hypothetical protein
MALGTITINKVSKFGNSNQLIVDCSIVGDGSYPTGGTTGLEASIRAALAASSHAIKGNYDLLGIQCVDANIDRVIKYVAATDALLAVTMSTGAQVANATNLAGETYRVLAFFA